METASGEYRFTRLEKIIFGPGKIAALRGELERRGLKRALIITGKTLGSSRLLDKVRAAAGDRIAGVFSGIRQHAPSGTVNAALAEARRVDADSLIGFGGGSPIDAAKAVAMAIMRGEDRIAIGAIDTHARMGAGAALGRELIQIAIPTTLSAAEYTPFGGVTDEQTRVKGGVGDPRLQPRTIILDPELTVETPGWLWACTGIRALDHAVEASYAPRHQPYTDTLAARAIELLTAHLLPSMQTQGSDELGHRVLCQTASWFSIAGAGNGLGLSHAMGHQIGARWDVPHGMTSCITLPHVMRFMAEIAPQRFGPIALGFGLRFDESNARLAALECAERAAKFIASLPVKTRLSQFDISREELKQIAAPVLGEINHAGTIDRPITEADLMGLLDKAY
jgi:alcohol dehydrogenase class IV